MQRMHSGLNRDSNDLTILTEDQSTAPIERHTTALGLDPVKPTRKMSHSLHKSGAEL